LTIIIPLSNYQSLFEEAPAITLKRKLEQSMD